MTHNEIMKQWVGKRVDFDWAYWYQCVDWVKKYCQLRDRKITTYGNAIDLWNKWLGAKWVRIVSSPGNFPSEGDIVIWNKNWGGGYWHIAVANRFCNPLVLRTTDQNAGSGNGDGLKKNAISPFFRSYSGVIGWYKYIG